MSATMRLLGTTAEGHSGPSEEMPLGWALRDTFLKTESMPLARRDRLGTSIRPNGGVIPLHPNRVMSMMGSEATRIRACEGDYHSIRSHPLGVRRSHPSVGFHRFRRRIHPGTDCLTRGSAGSP